MLVVVGRSATQGSAYKLLELALLLKPWKISLPSSTMKIVTKFTLETGMVLFMSGPTKGGKFAPFSYG